MLRRYRTPASCRYSCAAFILSDCAERVATSVRRSALAPLARGPCSSADIPGGGIALTSEMSFARHAVAPEPPLRAELYSADQMERHGKALAGGHRVRPGRRAGRRTEPLLARLTRNEEILLATGELLKATVTRGQRIAPAGEWLLDNFHLVEEQVRTAKRHLPKAYSRELPRLMEGAPAGLPRVYDIALEAISHGDGRLDAESLRRFVAAYQTLAPLKLGELWAIPIMLRLALIENLRRVAARIAASTAERELADTWADRMIQTAAQDPKS